MTDKDRAREIDELARKVLENDLLLFRVTEAVREKIKEDLDNQRERSLARRKLY
ncbi:MAG: hypothetical protein QNJ54_06065 [Prochloraceae cyanobacterium]|nr:hypothetical protein [Prochloraceae cyanobacterium]